MSASSHGGPGSPPDRISDIGGEDQDVPSTSGGGDSASVSLAEDDKLVETRSSDNIHESRVLKQENVDTGIGDASEGGNQSSSLITRGENSDLGKTDLANLKSEHTKVKGSVDDYDSMLSEFDHFASKGVSEAVGYGYEIGDMVWSKVKSHPWWPGHIYNEAFASPSVQRSKREGYVLVAFFGDSSYGWFDPAELVPFEENFADKFRQTSSRGFLKAVKEAVDELSRRRSLGLVCRCRNVYNFWPSAVKGYFVVGVGDNEHAVYPLSQINKARENFHPNEMLSFVTQLALAPMAHQHWTIESIKNRATVLACRKALFEEFDETYAQAFESVPVRPTRPTEPVSMDPSKAPLSGQLVIAEDLGKRKLSVKTTKRKDQLEKDKYLFKRRDEPTPMRTKKTGPGQVGGPAHPPLLIDGSGLSGIPLDSAKKGHLHQSSVSDFNVGQHQPVKKASVISDIKASEGSMKIVEVGMKNAKLHKPRAAELSAENATLVAKKKRKKEMTSERMMIQVEKTKKRKREIKNEASANMAKLPLPNSNTGASVAKVSGMLLDVPLSAANNQLNNHKNADLMPSSSSSEAKQAADLGKVEFPVLVKDLCALAVNPFHGVEGSYHATTRLVVLKYRSLVYQKSLVSSPPIEIETGEPNSRVLPTTTLRGAVGRTDEKSTMKLVKRFVRPDDPTKGGKKRGPSDRPEAIKKKMKLDDFEDINRRKKVKDVSNRNKLVHPEDAKTKKKKIVDHSKNVLPTQPRVVKVESSKRTEPQGKVRNPTMLVMKFPSGAMLPSGAHLRAKFARFGPLDSTATRVFYQTYTCRLVYQYKADAEEALKFARETGDLFGNTNVRYYIREVAVEAVEPEPIKIQKEDTSQSRETAVEHRTHLKMTQQPHQQLTQQQLTQQQLKSCLKKPANEEVSNGNGRGTRVKFILGGEERINSEQVSSYRQEGPSYTQSIDIGTKNFQKFVPQSPLPTTHPLQKYPINMPSVEPRPFNATPTQPILVAPKNDISQQLLNLLTRCSDVVNNVTGVLGYVPYHPL